jgi:vancomycin resistance protein YoaR
MTSDDRNPAAPEAATGGSPTEPTPPNDSPDAPPSRWLASSEGLVPSVPPATRQWQPEPDPEPEPFGAPDDLEGTRVQPQPRTAPDEWDRQPTQQTPAPVPARTNTAAAPRAYDPAAYAASGVPQTRGTWSSPAVAPQPQPVRPSGGSAGAAAAAAVPIGAYGWPQERRRGLHIRRLLFAFVVGLLLALFVAGGALYAYDQQYVGRVLPGVRIGNLDLSGMPVAAARDRIAQEYAGIAQGTVAVTLNGQTTEIPYSDFDRHVDANRLAIEAFAVGRATGTLDRLVGELQTITRGVELQPTVVLDPAKLQARVHDIAQAAESDPVDASAVVTSTGFVTTPSKTGQSVDEGTGAADAAARLATLDAPDRIDITLTATPLPPKVSDASAALASQQAALMVNDVNLVDGTDHWTIPAAAVHSWLGFTIINNRVRITIDTQTALADVQPLAKSVDRAAVNATVKLNHGQIEFGKPSTVGRALDPAATTEAIVSALRARALGSLAVDAPVTPVLIVTQPTLTTDEAKAAIPKMKAISSWTTNYQPSDHNGFGVNIRIPTATINGYVVNPGETFSFWKAVGPVTPELGYKPGGAIIDGHTEPQGALGGGICSCSTTLFNAVLRAGYQMGDRLNHYYYINRYPLGLDATVFISASGQAQDMTWTNDTNYPVIIQGINGTTFVKFVVYSVPNGRTTTFSDPIVKNYTKAHTETRVDRTIPKGTRKQIEYATDGQDVTVTRTVKDASGKVIHKETYYSHYATITGIILTNP